MSMSGFGLLLEKFDNLNKDLRQLQSLLIWNKSLFYALCKIEKMIHKLKKRALYAEYNHTNGGAR